MKNWPLTPAIELCTFAVDCINKTAPSTLKKTPYKMIRTSNIRNGSINTSDVRYVTKETFERWTKRSRPAFGDVILTREAPVGEVGRVTFTEEDNIFLGQRLFHYRPDPNKTDWNYFAYALKSKEVQDRIHGKSFGSTVPHIKVGDAENLLIPTPPLSEQRKIGHILSSYDDLITTNQRRIALLEEAARLIYREWFVNLRFPGRESIALKNGIPENWKKANLFEICAINYGYPFKSTHFNSTKSGTPAVRIRDIPDISTSTYTTEVVDDTYKIDRGDFLIGMDGIFHMNHWIGPKAYLVQRVCKVRPKNEKLLAYVGLALRDPIKTFETTIQGATVAHLGAKHLKQIEINVPVGLDEELGILNDLLWQQIHLREMNMQLAQARDLLLPKLMSGQIDVSNIQLSDEDVVT